MSDTVSSNKLLREFAPQIERTGKLGKLWIAFLVAVLLLGVFALYWQVSRGHIVTGMRDNVVWGVYIVNFIFFMGISYAGALISGALHLFHAGWRKPIIRMAEFITIISLLIGPVFIMLCIGRLDRLPTWTVPVPLTVVFVLILVYLVRTFALVRRLADSQGRVLP